MKWITFKTLKGKVITVKEDDVARIVIDPSTGEGTVTFNNSCYTYDIIDNGINKYLCGMSAASPLPDWDPDNLRKEIEDLKLENDRLKKRDDIMFDFIGSISCVRKQCSNCKLNRPDKFDELGAKCAYLQGPQGLEYIRNEAFSLIKRLEDL